jgi:hypothetical protein
MKASTSVSRILTTAVMAGMLFVSTLHPADAARGRTASTPAAVKKTPNLIKNPGAEAGVGSSNGSVVVVPNWKRDIGSDATVVRYGATGGFPNAGTPGAPNRGHNFFAGGPSSGSVQEFEQNINVSKYHAAIDAGHATVVLKAWLGGFQADADRASVIIIFYDGSGMLIDDGAVGPVTNVDRHNQTKFLMRSQTGPVPKTTRKILVLIRFDYSSGSFNDGYADNLSLVLSGI